MKQKEEVEHISKFDPVLKQVVSKVERGVIETWYLLNVIQNEQINCMSSYWYLCALL